MKEYTLQLRHLTELASRPQWKHYAWARAKELDAMPGFAGIAEALKASMAARSSASPSPSL